MLNACFSAISTVKAGGVIRVKGVFVQGVSRQTSPNWVKREKHVGGFITHTFDKPTFSVFLCAVEGIDPHNKLKEREKCAHSQCYHSTPQHVFTDTVPVLSNN